MTGAYSAEAIADLQRLTRDYASSTGSRSGPGNVLGGVVGLVVFGAVWLLGPRLITSIVAVGLTLGWLSGKEVLRERLNRRFGMAQEAWSPGARRLHHLGVLVITVALLGFAAWLVVAGWLVRPTAWPDLIFCVATPLIAWRSLFTMSEAIRGCGLLFLCAIVASGHMPDLLGLVIVPAYAATLSPVSLSKHRHFWALEAHLRARGGAGA